VHGLTNTSNRFDAFRSIFPAGTVSGAPKIKAIELVYGLEKERRGIYAGAVGRFDFANDEMDTCIAIRTMLFKDGTVYLQAGGGIVHDSVEEDEYQETIAKLGSNVRAVEQAEGELYIDYSYMEVMLIIPQQRIITIFSKSQKLNSPPDTLKRQARLTLLIYVHRETLPCSNINAYKVYLKRYYAIRLEKRLLCLAIVRVRICSSIFSRFCTPSRPATLNIPTINSAVRTLSSLAGIGYITIRGSAFESMMPMVGMCAIAHSRIACRFCRGFRKVTKSGLTFICFPASGPKSSEEFVNIPGIHFVPT
jgi:hypothetical protein